MVINEKQNRPATSMRILWLESDAHSSHNRSYLDEIFNEHDPCLASNICEAQDACRNEAPQIIFSDLNFSDGSALDLIIQLESISECQNTKVVIIATNGSEKDAAAVMKAGAFDYIPKNDLTKQRLTDILNEISLKNVSSFDSTSSNMFSEDAREILELMEVCYVVLDSEWRYVAINGAAENNLFSSSKDNFTGKVIWDLYPQMRNTPSYDACHRVVKTGIAEHFEGKSKINQKWFEAKLIPKNGYLHIFMRDIDERMQFEQSLKESEELFRLASEAVNGMLYDFNPSAKFTVRSEKLFELVGVHAADANPSLDWWISRIHPDDLVDANASVARALSSDAINFSKTYRVKHEKGHYIHVRDRGIIIRDETGSAVRIVGCTENCTSEIESLQEVERVRHQFEAIARAVPDVLYVYDMKDSKMVFINREILPLLGYSAKDIENFGLTRLMDIVHPEDKERVIESIEKQKRLSEGETYDVKFRAYSKDGEIRFLRNRGSAFSRDESNEVHEIIGIIQDITDNQKKQQEIEESKALLSTLITKTPLGFTFIDANKRYQIINQPLADLHGVPIEHHLGKSISDIRPDIAPQTEEVIEKVMKTGEMVINEISIEIPDAPGEVRHWLQTWYPVTKDNGELLGVGETVLEITESKRAEQRIRELNLRLQRSVAESHHRIKNNLQVLASLIDVHIWNGSDTVPTSELVRLNQHVRTLGMLHDLLTHDAKMENSSGDEIQLDLALEKLIYALKHSVGNRELKWDFQSFTVNVKQARSAMLIVNELVSNAVKHGHGDIILKLYSLDDKAVIEVLDDGDGFSDDFDFQISANTGLELVRSLAEWDMQGNVYFENRNEGGGSAKVVFPLEDKFIHESENHYPN